MVSASSSALELLALILHDRRFVLAASGVALALVLLNVRRCPGTRNANPRPNRTPTISGIRCAAGLPPPRRRSGGRSPPGRTGTGICVRCSRAGTKSTTGQRQAKDPDGISRDRAHAVRRRTVGMGQSQQRHAEPVTASPVPAGRRWKRFCESWSRYDRRRHDAGRDHHGALRGGARRNRTRGGGKALGAHADPHRGARARPRTHRRPARPGQDADRAILRRRAGAAIHPGAVHAGPAARGPARLDDLRHAVGPLRVPGRPHLHQPVARRRDQPHATQDPGGAARGDGRRPGQHRWRNPQAANAIHRSGHRQPDRVRGHLSAARGAARSVRDPAGAAIPLGARRDRDAAPPPRTRFGRADGQSGRGCATICSRCANRSSR